MNKSWFFKKAFHFSQIELVLDKILQELKKLHGTNPQAARNLPDLIDGTGVPGASGTCLLTAKLWRLSTPQNFIWVGG